MTDLFAEGWFDTSQAAPPPAEERGATDPAPSPSERDDQPLDLTAGIGPDDIHRAGRALEHALASQLDRGYTAMVADMRALIPAGRTPTPSDAQPVIARLTDARDFSLRMATAWTATAKHAEALVGNVVEEAGEQTFGRTGARSSRAVVSDGHGAEIVAAYKPKIVHEVNSDTVVGAIRAFGGLRATDAVALPGTAGTDGEQQYEPEHAYHLGVTWALETLLRLANVDRAWRRTEIDVFARQIEEAGHPQLAAELRRAVGSHEEEGKTVVERREPSRGRARGAEDES